MPTDGRLREVPLHFDGQPPIRMLLGFVHDQYAVFALSFQKIEKSLQKENSVLPYLLPSLVLVVSVRRFC